MDRKPCIIDGCDKRGPRKHCAMHETRIRRHGDPHCAGQGRARVRNGDGRYMGSDGYLRLTRMHGHPVCDPATGNAREHRVVLYDAIGGGEHPCHWCGVTLEWFAQVYADRLTVDHDVDHNRTNNDLSNLVPACGSCNSSRSAVRRHRGGQPWRQSDADALQARP